MTTIYGIKNCDTMKKAFTWLDEHKIAYTFHDYKKQGLDEAAFERALKQHGWENVINRRGTTWHKLPEATQKSMNAEKALEIARENPSIIKRPLLSANDDLVLGFSEDSYAKVFK
ncbi:MAG: ArsC family reductase [Alphaproteobacteria bacterium]|nr:ArsC family reductase [Alphaproteobacteria bacterium]